VTDFQAVVTRRHDAYKLLSLSGFLVASRLEKEASAESRDQAALMERTGAARAGPKKLKVIYHSEVAHDLAW
jgi:hypothetical protein